MGGCKRREERWEGRDPVIIHQPWMSSEIFTKRCGDPLSTLHVYMPLFKTEGDTNVMGKDTDVVVMVTGPTMISSELLIT